jgi:hypothetical protein
VAIYGWKGIAELAREIHDARVHRADEIAIHTLDAAWLDAIAATLDRNNHWSLAISGGTLYLDVGGRSFEGTITRA